MSDTSKPTHDWNLPAKPPSVHDISRDEHDRLKGAMLALESLTPGGSEFVGDVKACVEYVRKRQTMLFDQVKRFKLANDRLKRIEKLARELAVMGINIDICDADAVKAKARAILDADKDNPESGQEPRK